MADTTSLKLPHELKRKVSTLAQGVAQTPHAYMVEAIAEKVLRDEKRRAFINDAAKSLAQFKRTGIAYTHEQVWDYLSSKAHGKKPRKPNPMRVPRAKR
jgi:predicted transcriptional regulator